MQSAKCKMQSAKCKMQSSNWQRRASAFCILHFALCTLHCSIASAEDLVILPQQFTLSGLEARQRLVVERVESNQFIGQVPGDVKIVSSDPAIVAIEEGLAIPKANGSAILSVEHGGRKAQAEVTVEDMDRPFLWSFRNHVEPVLFKAGCSSGACHGAQAGKKGFKLSLRGYDPLGDYHQI